MTAVFAVGSANAPGNAGTRRSLDKVSFIAAAAQALSSLSQFFAMAADEALCLSHQTKPPASGPLGQAQAGAGGLVWAQSSREVHRPESTNF